nr:putative LAGLIDADG homing endonuclease [Oedogonium sp. 1_circle_61917]
MYTVGLDIDTLNVSEVEETLLSNTALFAGTNLNDVPNILKTRMNGKIHSFYKLESAGNITSSAGNLLDYKKKLSPHRPKNSKLNDDQFGFYLAGLIEGDGHYNTSIHRLEIRFHEKDLFLAQRIRTRIGFGSVYKVKEKKAYKLSIGSRKGIERLYLLCNGKFVLPFKIEQFNKNPYGYTFLPPTKIVDLSNSWLSGLIDADGTIGLFLAKSPTNLLGISVRLSIRIIQKNSLVLEHIRAAFNEKLLTVSHRKTLNISKDKMGISRLAFVDRKGSLRMLIEYLDYFPLRSKKALQFFYLRKAYLIMEKKEHLTFSGLNIIKKFKTRTEKLYK